jgi:hypothetical protein
MNTPIVTSLSEATEKQRVFLELACIEYVIEEREFQIRLHGGKPQRHDNSVREAGLKVLKNPEGIKPVNKHYAKK